MTVSELISWLKAWLSEVIPDSAQLNAECNLLLSHFLDLSIEAKYTHPEKEISAEKYEALREAVTKRVQQRMPVQYLLGQAWFYKEVFEVNSAVLIPRRETELMIDSILESTPQNEALKVLDLATGSGCIAITLKKHRPAWVLTATDISPGALEVAKKNAKHHHTEIQFVEGSWFEPLSKEERFDIVVCNPPYIDLSERPKLSPEVLAEPLNALFSPQSPQLLYQFLLENLQKFLHSDGKAWFELGMGQAVWVKPLAESMGYRAFFVKDYQGIARILVLAPL